MSTPNQTPVTREELQAEIARLEAINADLRKQEQAEFRMQVSEKGAISIYGMGRFPVTLYKEQWEKVLSHASEIIQFGNSNEKILTANQAKSKLAAAVEKAALRKAK